MKRCKHCKGQKRIAGYNETKPYNCYECKGTGKTATFVYVPYTAGHGPLETSNRHAWRETLGDDNSLEDVLWMDTGVDIRVRAGVYKLVNGARPKFERAKRLAEKLGMTSLAVALDMVYELNQYAILDDDLYLRMEQKAIEDSWNSWGRSAFHRLLDSLWDQELDPRSFSDAAIDSVYWNAAAEASHGQFPTYEGGGPVFGFDVWRDRRSGDVAEWLEENLIMSYPEERLPTWAEYIEQKKRKGEELTPEEAVSYDDYMQRGGDLYAEENSDEDVQGDRAG